MVGGGAAAGAPVQQQAKTDGDDREHDGDGQRQGGERVLARGVEDLGVGVP